jgi:hypothetical protein
MEMAKEGGKREGETSHTSKEVHREAKKHRHKEQNTKHKIS